MQEDEQLSQLGCNAAPDEERDLSSDSGTDFVSVATDNNIDELHEEKSGFTSFSEEQVATEQKQVVSSFAIAAFILSVCSCSCNLFTAIPALIMSYLGYQQIKEEPSKYKGVGFIWTAVVISVVVPVVSIGLRVIQLLLLVNDPEFSNILPNNAD